MWLSPHHKINSSCLNRILWKWVAELDQPWMWCRSERSKRSRRILFGCLWCKCRKRIAPPHSPFFLSVFLTLSLLCISEPIGAAQRRVTQISAEAKTGCLVEAETIAEILQNPSDTPSATHTQMARKNRKWSHRAVPSPSLACYCRSQPIPWADYF